MNRPVSNTVQITGIVTGLPFEAAVYRRALSVGDTPGPQIVCGGAQAKSTRKTVATLLAGEAAALMSFGLAGGLDSACRPGDIILADRVISPGGEIFTSDAGWLARVHGQALESRIDTRIAQIAGSDRPRVSASEKQSLHAKTGADAVDMESHIAAQAAHAAGVPFLALRVVVDPVMRSIPPAALKSLDEDGQIRLAAVLRSLLGRPAQIPGLIALSVDAARARAGLRRAARLRADLIVGV